MQMTKVMRDGVRVLALAGMATAAVHAADNAAQFPARPVRMIVTFTPGGATDMVARAVGQQLADRLGQQFVVDNRAGGGGRTRAVNRVPACGMRTSASRETRR